MCTQQAQPDFTLQNVALRGTETESKSGSNLRTTPSCLTVLQDLLRLAHNLEALRRAHRKEKRQQRLVQGRDGP
jgi:hypothetical protein